MNQAYWTIERAAGTLLFSGLVVALLALIITVASGALPAFSADLQGSLAAKAPYAATFRRATMLFAVDWIVQLLGFGLLALSLLRAGQRVLAILAFITVLVAAILGLFHGTFNMSVEVWAAQEAARTGSVPELYEVMQNWISDTFRIGYFMHLMATAGFGWGILRSGLLDPWVGWAALGWSILWILGGLVGAGAPAIPILMPAVIGAALLWR